MSPQGRARSAPARAIALLAGVAALWAPGPARAGALGALPPPLPPVQGAPQDGAPLDTAPSDDAPFDTVRIDPRATSRPQTPTETEDAAVPAPDAAEERWELSWASMDSRLEGDVMILIIREPVLRRGDEMVRATWAILWTDEDATLLRPPGFEPDLRVAGEVVLEPQRTRRRTRTLWDEIEEAAQRNPQLENLRELYLEGPIEYFVADDRVAFADAIYIDMIDRLGWIADANYEMLERVGGSRFAFKVQAGWLRLSSDGSLTSSDARLTTCEFAVPHFFITSGSLRLVPTDDPDRPIRVLARRNAIRIGKRLRIPMPPVDGLIDEEGDLTIGGLQVGQSPRFGTVVGLEYNRDVREEIGARVNRLLRGDPENFRSRLRLSASYLGSRGALLDLGLRLRSPGIYEWNSDLGFVPDGAEDKGLVRVPEGDRPYLRSWFRSRGRYELGRREWVDLAVTVQTDPGVQSEFFEDEYLEFAERRSHLHWRRATGADYSSATIGGTFDSFRTEVQTLPVLRRERQRAPIADLGPAPLLYGSSTAIGVYDRTEGDPGFEAPFPDGAGETTLLRGDHTSRLEVPLHLGFAGLTLVPFVDGRLTGWSEDAEADESPLGRAALVAGSRLSTVVWRETGGGGLQQIIPSIEYGHGVVEESPDRPALDLFDDVDDPLSGEFVTLGLRARWFGEAWPFELDGGVRATHAADVDGNDADDDGDDEQGDGWRPLGFFARFDSQIGDVPIAVAHDSRHDIDDHRTVYSRTLVGIRPIESLDLRFSFTQGVADIAGEDFEAAAMTALYRFSPKWEFEGRQQLSLLDDRALDTRVTLRRYGHDVMFELTVSERAGESGTSVGVRVRPILTAKRRPPVLLPD